MSIVNTGISAIGRLAALALLLGAFLFGLAGVVYMSLQGEEIPVPEITGKHLSDGEKELAAHGLKIRKRADRQSAEQPGIVIEQLPKAGETVKTGQWISVVVSKGGVEPDVPESLKKADEDDAEKIEEMISDKPKKPKANSNSSRKKADTGRDVNSNAATANSNSKSSETDSDKKESPSNNNSTEKKGPQTPAVKPTNPGTKPPAGDTKPKPPAKP